jgi:hypothetical protein
LDHAVHHGVLIVVGITGRHGSELHRGRHRERATHYAGSGPGPNISRDPLFLLQYIHGRVEQNKVAHLASPASKSKSNSSRLPYEVPGNRFLHSDGVIRSSRVPGSSFSSGFAF